jgi:hypothetical protein
MGSFLSCKKLLQKPRATHSGLLNKVYYIACSDEMEAFFLEAAKRGCGNFSFSTPPSKWAFLYTDESTEICFLRLLAKINLDSALYQISGFFYGLISCPKCF